MDDTILTNISNEYIIPARLLKQLVAAAEPAPKPSHFELLLKFLQASGISYGCDNPSCGDSRITQIWFTPDDGWELVFTFDAETGAYQEMYLEA